MPPLSLVEPRKFQKRHLGGCCEAAKPHPQPALPSQSSYDEPLLEDPANHGSNFNESLTTGKPDLARALNSVILAFGLIKSGIFRRVDATSQTRFRRPDF